MRKKQIWKRSPFSAWKGPLADEQYNATLAELEAIKSGLEKIEQDRQALKITSPIAGVILPPVWKSEKPNTQNEKVLRTWNGSPFEKRNRGCYLQPGELLCQVGDPHRLEALLIIDQNDIQLVRQGQSVKIQLLQNTSKIIEGTVIEISEIDLDLVPEVLAAENSIGHAKKPSRRISPQQHLLPGQSQTKSARRTATHPRPRPSKNRHRLATPWHPGLPLDFSHIPVLVVRGNSATIDCMQL